MRHDIVLEGYGVRLRPVTLEDAAFIVKLRNMPHAVGRIGDSATTAEMQKKWLEKYFSRDNDYYFIVESLSSVPLGTISVYNIDFERHTAEIGRLVMAPGTRSVLAASILRNDFSFYSLGLDMLIACIVSTNKTVLSYNRKLGAEITHIAHNERIIASSPVDMVYLKLTKETWKKKRESLIQLAEQAVSFQKK